MFGSFFAADVVTSTSSKSTDVTNNINDVSVLFKCPSRPKYTVQGHEWNAAIVILSFTPVLSPTVTIVSIKSVSMRHAKTEYEEIYAPV